MGKWASDFVDKLTLIAKASLSRPPQVRDRKSSGRVVIVLPPRNLSSDNVCAPVSLLSTTMGICLSCLRPNDDDNNDLNNDYSENSPLLNDEDNAVNAQFYEARNNELEDIVNNANENLIDVTNFHLDSNQEVQPSEKGATYLSPTQQSEKELSELEVKVREDFAIDESLKSLPLVLNLE